MSEEKLRIIGILLKDGHITIDMFIVLMEEVIPPVIYKGYTYTHEEGNGYIYPSDDRENNI